MPAIWKDFYDKCRKYNKRWEQLFPWVRESESGKPYCQWCGVLIIARKHSIAQHNKSLRHRANAEMFQETGVVQEDPGVGMAKTVSFCGSSVIQTSITPSNENCNDFDYMDGTLDNVDQENFPVSEKRKQSSPVGSSCTTRVPSSNNFIRQSSNSKVIPVINLNRTKPPPPTPIAPTKILLDVSQFHSDELDVRVNGADIEVEARHEEREDDHGSVGRHFIRKYALPAGALTEQMVSSLSDEGILTIEIPKEKTFPPLAIKSVTLLSQKESKTTSPLGRNVKIKLMKRD